MKILNKYVLQHVLCFFILSSKKCNCYFENLKMNNMLIMLQKKMSKINYVNKLMGFSVQTIKVREIFQL